MNGHALALAAGAALLLLVLLAIRLRGPRDRPDLLGPPKRRRRRLRPGEAERLTALVAAGRGDEALRQIREMGFDETDAQKLVRFIAGFQAAVGAKSVGDPPPEPGWTETAPGEDGLAYGRGFDFNPTLQREDARGERGELYKPE